MHYFRPMNDPSTPTNYEGFFHLYLMAGNVEKATLTYIIRDHNASIFKNRCELFKASAEWLNQRHGEGTVSRRDH